MYIISNSLIVVYTSQPLPLKVAQVLVVDLDVHQGNGTGKIFEQDSSVYTISLHQAKGYPFSTRSASDWDLDLPDRCGDDEYLEALEPLETCSASWFSHVFTTSSTLLTPLCIFSRSPSCGENALSCYCCGALT